MALKKLYKINILKTFFSSVLVQIMNEKVAH
jgi:hypothetical protein